MGIGIVYFEGIGGATRRSSCSSADGAQETFARARGGERRGG